MEVMRVAAVVHWPVTHGPLAAGGVGRVQPATMYSPVTKTVGCPETNTRVLTAVG
jgi:hypothetical protein